MLQIEIEIQQDNQPVQIKEFSFANTVEDMTHSQYDKFNLLCTGWPDWLKEFSELNQADRVETRADWTKAQEAEYYYQLCKVVANFSNPNSLVDVMNLEMFAGDVGATADSIEVLASMAIGAISNYKANPGRRSFEHKGQKFIIPDDEIVKLGELKQATRLPNASAGEVIEALQRQHILGGKDEAGNPVLPDARYHTDVAIVACVCRKIDKDGQPEKVPLGMQEFSRFINARIEFLADLPAAVGLDVGFFLASSLRGSISTAMQSWRFKNPRKRGKKRKRGKGRLGLNSTRKGGKRGGGIPPSTK